MESTNPTFSLIWKSIVTYGLEEIEQDTYGLNNTTDKNRKLKAYYCLDKESHWLINLSILNSDSQEHRESESKIAFNNKIIYSNNSSFNFSYVTDKTKDMNFLIQLGKEATLFNGTVTPVNAMELNFNQLNPSNDFTVIEEEKYITRSNFGTYKIDKNFKLPKKVIM